MIPLLRSIRWRLQAWHGLMLLLVLLAFGVTAYFLTFDNRMRRVDRELERRALPLVGFYSRFGAPPGDRGPGRFRGLGGEDFRGPGERRFEGPGGVGGERPEESRRLEPPPRQDGRPPEGERFEPRRFEGPGPDGPRFAGGGNPPPDLQRLLEELAAPGYYHVVWSAEHTELRRSTNAPARLAPPAWSPALTNGLSRTRDGSREYIQLTRRGATVLVGADITPDLAELRRLAWLLTGAGGGVLLLGLAGGWWLSTRAIRPIQDISATAAKIADGDLSERIHVPDAASELAELAGVLNHTFGRLEQAFARQVQFTADASHELRTPVSVILSQTQTALKRERSGEDYRETIAACQRASQRMSQLIESLLELARLDAGQEPLRREGTDLAKVAREAADLITPMAAERRLTLTPQLAPAPCQGDPGRLAQVVTNLLTNAVHYNREGGTIELRTWSEGPVACLAVADTGIGIAAEDVPHLFERFYRVDKSRTAAGGRTGLGLAIVKSIVEAHGGKITVTSQPGQGTTFTVRI